MGLDVGIYAGSDSKDPLERDLVVNLEDGDTVFLYNVFEDVRNRTGIEIVPWDDARLGGGQLKLFDDHLIERISAANKKLETWEEYVGFQVKPKKKLYTPMVKIEVLKKLNNLRKLINIVEARQGVLFFFGD